MTARTWWWLLAAVVALRLATLGAYPLTDTTEARYAEMAHKMLASGNWLTPMFDVGVPFWGKPPLSFWLSALPMAVLGVGEFSARLGPLLAALFCLFLFLHWPTRGDTVAASGASSARQALPWVAATVFLSTPLGFIASGAVMTDMAMVAGTSLSMLAFWRAWNAAGLNAEGPAETGTAASSVSVVPAAGPWPWLFFAGQAIGLLAKGPVASVLTGVALGLFLLLAGWQSGLRMTALRLWRALPWLRGLLLSLVLVLPWYALAERATPGFLHYFIVGEHWSRFTQSGWKGDLYGVAHAQPKGRIWLFAVLCTLPWALVSLWWWWQARGAARRDQAPAATTLEAASERNYLLAWMLAAPLFFTLSGNILPAYVLPGLPAFALLLAHQWRKAPPGLATQLLAGVAALLTPLAFAGLVLFNGALFAQFSEQENLRQVAGELSYLEDRPASAVFYGQARARLLKDETAIAARLSTHNGSVAVPVRRLDALGPRLAAQGWREVSRSKEFAVFQPNPP